MEPPPLPIDPHFGYEDPDEIERERRKDAQREEAQRQRREERDAEAAERRVAEEARRERFASELFGGQAVIE